MISACHQTSTRTARVRCKILLSHAFNVSGLTHNSPGGREILICFFSRFLEIISHFCLVASYEFNNSSNRVSISSGEKTYILFVSMESLWLRYLGFAGWVRVRCKIYQYSRTQPVMRSNTVESQERSSTIFIFWSLLLCVVEMDFLILY
jgi:hypothetical protein